ncbi:hypothetical protein CI105_02160 [Candidatus Izimaplasma bacterium ZiA1]|uniref:flavodoxin family protein n=1 Tax=Candidatus Izimoplasma sp. ZiA1 TaxID=2024899 RepID=UPI000BAA51CF|nr:hypothetical protein CI105_02160 [Candidatus Izimaplasma bacterium ZiA1]
MILIINGSPNKNSKTLKLAKSFATKDYMIINAYEQLINSCDDCKFCETKDGCKFNDDMNNIYNIINEVDTLIISSPIYFGSLSDKTMSIINRFQTYFSKKYQRKESVPTIKNLILVSTQGSYRKEFFNGPLQTMFILSKVFSSTFSEHLLIPSADQGVALNDNHKEKIDKIKKEIN